MLGKKFQKAHFFKKYFSWKIGKTLTLRLRKFVLISGYISFIQTP